MMTRCACARQPMAGADLQHAGHRRTISPQHPVGNTFKVSEWSAGNASTASAVSTMPCVSTVMSMRSPWALVERGEQGTKDSLIRSVRALRWNPGSFAPTTASVASGAVHPT